LVSNPSSRSTIERHELGPAKRACEAQQQRRPVAEVLEALGAERAIARAASANGRFTRRAGPDGAADAAERGAHVFRIGWWLQVGGPMGVADGRTATRNGRCAGSLIGLMGEERRNRAGGQSSSAFGSVGSSFRGILRTK
jgi:hypothetical protein